MGYKLRYLRSGREIGSEIVGTLSIAQDLAERGVDSGTFDAAEVVDADGRVVFRRPRTVRSA